jgi:hypothetical protein
MCPNIPGFIILHGSYMNTMCKPGYKKMVLPTPPGSRIDPPIEHVALDREWRLRNPDSLEFIFIAVGEDARLLSMLIGWTDGIAYRVWSHIPPIDMDHWLKAKPTRKLIVLG